MPFELNTGFTYDHKIKFDRLNSATLLMCEKGDLVKYSLALREENEVLIFHEKEVAEIRANLYKQIRELKEEIKGLKDLAG
jgi:hypothetical protein